MTPLPAEIVVPGPGVTWRTVPCGLSEEIASVLAITKPAAARDARASISVSPTKSGGTIASPGPSESVMMTLDPGFALLVARGNWLAIKSLGIRGS